MDHALFLLSKEYRRLAGRKAKAEIILVGGAAILASLSFRESTMDLDAYILADRDLKTAISHVADIENLPADWLNDDFVKTESFSKRLIALSEPYKTFSNCLMVRTIPAKYLLAMKLVAWRPYKHDQSDAVSILLEAKEKGDPMEFQGVMKAIEDLYGDTAKMKISEEELKKLIDECNSTLVSEIKASE